MQPSNRHRKQNNRKENLETSRKFVDNQEDVVISCNLLWQRREAVSLLRKPFFVQMPSGL